VKLGKEAAPLVGPHFGSDDAKDFSSLYSSNYDWVAEGLHFQAEGAMQEAIETRELIMLDGPDGDIRGTYHRPNEGSFYPRSLPIAPGRIGVLFLNSTSPTRAQNGDAAVYLADSFASCGYPSFRLDLPGFGDSQGSRRQTWWALLTEARTHPLPLPKPENWLHDSIYPGLYSLDIARARSLHSMRPRQAASAGASY